MRSSGYTRSGRSYTKAGRDYRELFFFLILFASLFFKFKALNLAVSPYSLIHLSSIASTAGIILCILVISSLLYRRVRCFAALLANLLLTALIITDLLHMRYYSDLFTFSNLGLATQVGDISDSVFALFSLKDLLFFADFPPIIAYCLIFKKVSVKPFFKRMTFKRVVCSLLLFAAGAFAVHWRISTYKHQVPGVLVCMWDRPAVSNSIGVLTYHLADARNVIGEIIAKKAVTEEQLQGLRERLAKRRSPAPDEIKHFGAARGKNLLIIQAESLQHFVVGLKLNGKELTPNINRFCRESVYFSSVYNQTASGNSSDAEFLANAGLYPSPSGVAYTKYAGNRYEALPAALRRKGYRTVALHGDKPAFWNRHHMYPALGFEKYYSKKDFEREESIGLGLSDRSFFRQTADILANEKKPFYAFAVTLTSHYPFSFTKIAVQTPLDVGEFKDSLMGNYLTSMRYLDNQFGMFMELLKQKNLLDNTVIVLYGDHTAIPKWHSANLEKLLQRDLSEPWQWRSVLKIPLMIRLPEGKVRYENKKSAGLIDLPKSLASLLGVEFKEGFGENLFDGSRRGVAVFRKGAYVANEVLVDPSSESAVSLRDGKKMDYSSYAELTAQTAQDLADSDLILIHDLVPKIVEWRETEEKN
jgi:lipoteichoic acid synthase